MGVLRFNGNGADFTLIKAELTTLMGAEPQHITTFDMEALTAILGSANAGHITNTDSWRANQTLVWSAGRGFFVVTLLQHIADGLGHTADYLYLEDGTRTRIGRTNHSAEYYPITNTATYTYSDSTFTLSVSPTNEHSAGGSLGISILPPTTLTVITKPTGAAVLIEEIE